ncbi:MAG: TetR/AcrR family transcriptional regulator [Alphaproteobacteria bacterium]|nr:TetR/AcrR family transcriptional regulator [Alphaproteobacteria bacterium]
MNIFDIETDSLSTRDRLVIKTAELLMRESFGTVSVDDICKATDIKKGTFYHHFASKADLAIAAYDWKWEYFKKILDHCFDNALLPAAQLERYADEVYKMQKRIHDIEGKVYGCPHANAGQEMGAQDDRIRQKIADIFDKNGAYLAGFLARLPAYAEQPVENRMVRAQEMFSYTMGILYQAKIMNDPEVIRRDLLVGLKRLVGVEGQPTS